jgi:hypothetical protein
VSCLSASHLNMGSAVPPLATLFAGKHFPPLSFPFPMLSHFPSLLFMMTRAHLARVLRRDACPTVPVIRIGPVLSVMKMLATLLTICLKNLLPQTFCFSWTSLFTSQEANCQRRYRTTSQLWLPLHVDVAFPGIKTKSSRIDTASLESWRATEKIDTIALKRNTMAKYATYAASIHSFFRLQ